MRRLPSGRPARRVRRRAGARRRGVPGEPRRRPATGNSRPAIRRGRARAAMRATRLIGGGIAADASEARVPPGRLAGPSGMIGCPRPRSVRVRRDQMGRGSDAPEASARLQAYAAAVRRDVVGAAAPPRARVAARAARGSAGRGSGVACGVPPSRGLAPELVEPEVPVRKHVPITASRSPAARWIAIRARTAGSCSGSRSSAALIARRGSETSPRSTRSRMCASSANQEEPGVGDARRRATAGPTRAAVPA